MPPKRKVAYEESESADNQDDDLADGNPKRSRAEDSLALSETLRRSSRNGRGTRGRIAQMQEFERLQVQDGPGKVKSRRLAELDAATKDQEVNPMAPSSELQHSSRPCPRPRLRSKHTDSQEASATQPSSESSAVRPSFAVAVPGQQFGSRSLGSTDHIDSGEHSPDLSHSPPPPSSRASSIFSGRASHSSTAPTSRTPSVCSSGRGNQEVFSRRRSSNLQKLALTSQSGIEAPMRMSRVTASSSTEASLIQQPSHWGTSGMGEAVPLVRNGRDEESAAPPPRTKSLASAAALFSELCDDSDPDSPPPRHIGLRRTASLHQIPREIYEEHSILVSNDLDMGDPNLEIDEVAPSEDERVAEAALRGEDSDSIQRDVSRLPADYASTGTLEETTGPRLSHSEGNSTNSRQDRDVEDVVAVHRRRNRAPRLPTNSQLAAVRDQQRSTSTSRNTSSAPAGAAQGVPSRPPEASSRSNSHVEPSQARVPTATEGADPSQLQFYEPAVHDMIERAKQFSHCDAASIDAFPHRAEFNKIALEYVEEAIQERRAQSLIIPEDWWPQYANDICKLLWEDLGNWRSALRKKARTYVTQRYQWDPENRRDVNKNIARQLLGDNGAFLRDGVDADGKTNNFAHPTLAGLILDFFYGGDKSVGKQFPEVFSTEVPRVTVAISATALKVVLDEIASQGEVNFRVATYSPIYLEMLGLMKKCDTSATHAMKTQALRCRWAETGSGVQCGALEATSSFDVVLD